MTERDFVYWLQGFFEINSAQANKTDIDALSVNQVEMIKNHLSLVLKRVTMKENPPISFPSSGSTFDFLKEPTAKLC